MQGLSAALRRDMESKGIDVKLSLSILEDWNSGFYDSVKPVKAVSVPAVDGRRVVDTDGLVSLKRPAAQVRELLSTLGIPEPAGLRREDQGEGEVMIFDRLALEELGMRLLPFAAWGVLNGGSATSYADRKKNKAYGDEVFDLLEEGFDRLEPLCRDRPKGLAPAFLNPDGSPGPSFLLLKMRARLLLAGAYRARYGDPGRPFLPLFQMSSSGNNAELSSAYEAMSSEALLAEPAAALGGLVASGALSWATGIQPMISAFSHSSEGRTKTIFDRAWGRPDSALALPGGHGQSFRILAKVLRKLRASGLRWAWLGNVDNLGFVPDPIRLAILALSGEPAAFEFAYRTPLDVKGGILVETADGGRTIADIGPAISFDEVRALEAGGSSILFNCATGLFDLDWLVPRLDEIGRALPVRFSDQDKDAGRYSQAEQVTWEVASLLPSFLSFAVRKEDRFIAAKLLAETLLASGIGLGDPRIPPDLAAASRSLHRGLVARLSGEYGLELRDGLWIARS
ncbi:MAG TPA: UTP--glucose-1-phosphate uridylyltransferase [Rectinemataceae bacterium]|nr:UTP--glucose-1-phosphate uridylyltransferase [Rectinemataceae bacterium]